MDLNMAKLINEYSENITKLAFTGRIHFLKRKKLREKIDEFENYILDCDIFELIPTFIDYCLVINNTNPYCIAISLSQDYKIIIFKNINRNIDIVYNYKDPNKISIISDSYEKIINKGYKIETLEAKHILTVQYLRRLILINIRLMAEGV